MHAEQRAQLGGTSVLVALNVEVAVPDANSEPSGQCPRQAVQQNMLRRRQATPETQINLCVEGIRWKKERPVKQFSTRLGASKLLGQGSWFVMLLCVKVLGLRAAGFRD